jgi:hypothetical protein
MFTWSSRLGTNATPFANAPCGATATGTFTQGTVTGSVVTHFAAIPATTLSTGAALLDRL